MYKFWVLGVFILVAIAVLASWFFFQNIFGEEARPVPENPLYKDSTVTIAERVDDLLSYMTLEEKIGQMALVEKNSLSATSDISEYGLGALLSGFGAKPEDNSPEGWSEMVGGFMSEAKKSRLGIPIFYGVDAIHGHSNVLGFTTFPHFIGLGATGNSELVKEIAKATKEQLLLTNVNWSYSPTYDMPQDIRWGRVYETFSDDPELVGRLGRAYVEGLQEDSGGEAGVIQVLATPKHFIGAGSMQWETSSNADFIIDQGTTEADEEKLKQSYLPPFQEAIDAGALSIMVGLNSWGSTKLAGESNLINSVLKNDLGFTGFVVSDWYGVYEISENDYESALIAINAGVDMVMLPFDYKNFIKNVASAVRSDDISQERIDDAVRRILRAKFAVGLFDKTPDKNAFVDIEAQKKLARRAVAESAVLLKNQANLLPLAPGGKTFFVSGSAADNIGMQTGAWTIEWQGIDGNWLPGATSILQGITSVAGPNANIVYSLDAQFGTVDKKADLGIAVVGEKPYAEGWGDNANPTLSSEDIETINRLKLVSEKVVVVLVTGRPLLITYELEGWDALVVAWLPGSEGSGVADVLFGKQRFTGRLPLPWPASLSQLPIETGGQTSDGTDVLFPRYFGLR